MTTSTVNNDNMAVKKGAVNTRTDNKHTILLWIIATGLIALNVSSDHVFYKSNSLKLLILVATTTACIGYIIYGLAKKSISAYTIRYLLIGLAPILATLPGYFLNLGQYDYATPHEALSQVSCVLIMFAVIVAVRNESDLWFILKVASGVAVFVCLIGFLEKAGLDPLKRLFLNPFERIMLGEPEGYSGLRTRIESTFGNINYFAGFLIMVIPASFASMLARRHSSRPFVLAPNSGIVFVLATLALLMTGTRAALAASIIALLIYLVFYTRLIKRFSKLKMAIGIGGMTAALLILSFFVNESLITRFTALLELSAWQSRFVPWDAAMQSILEAPFFGYGIGSSYELFFNFVNPDSQLFTSERSYNHVHMEWLEILQEGGLAGFLVYFAFWTYVFITGFRLVFNTTVEARIRVLLLGFICSLIAFHVHGFFSVAPRMISVRVIAYGLAGLIFALGEIHQRKKESPYNTRVNPLYIVPAMTVLLYVVGWAWLIPYLNAHLSYSKQLVKTDPEELAALAIKTKDLYIMDTALRELAQPGREGDFSMVVENMANASPVYRQALYYSAIEKFKAGDIHEAIEKGLKAQNHNKFSEETAALLAYGSLILNDEELFARQLKLMIRLYSCKTHILVNCNDDIDITIGEMAAPIQFIAKDNQLSIYLDAHLITTLKQLLVDKDDISNVERDIVELSQHIGQSGFFIPRTLLSAPEDIKKELRRYLSLQETMPALKDKIRAPDHLPLWRQIQYYMTGNQERELQLGRLTAEMTALENRLSFYLNVDEFVNRREFLHKLSGWLLQIARHDAIDVKNF